MSTALDRIDRAAARFMQRWSLGALRISMGIVFIWFGALKPFGLSPAEPLVLATVGWFPVMDGATWLVVLGWWEVVIGLAFLFPGTVRIGVAMLAVQMVGTLLPLVLLPEVTFQAGLVPFGLTMEGQYIIKNLFIISAGMVLGGAARQETPIKRARVARAAQRQAPGPARGFPLTSYACVASQASSIATGGASTPTLIPPF